MRLHSLAAITRTTRAALKATTNNSPFVPSPRRTMVLAPQTPLSSPTAASTTTTTTTTALPPADLTMAPPPPSSPPAFTIREATPADAEAMCDVFFDAFAEDEIARRVFPAGSRRARAEMLGSFAEDVANPACHKFVAAEPATGHVVAVVTWTPPGTAWERYPGADDNKSEKKKEKEEEEGGGEEKEEVEGDRELGAEFFAMMDRKHAEHLGGRPHWTLGFLAVRRAWQGRGVARPLVAWGLARADRDGLPAYVQASPRAVPVYRRFGFEQIDAYPFRRIDYVEVFMLRPPRPLSGEEGGAAAEDGEVGAAPP